MKILIAIDGSSYTKKMLAYLTTHPELFSPANSYTLMTVHRPIPANAKAALGKDVVDTYYREECEKITAPVAKFLLRHGIDAKSQWKVGEPGDVLAAAAKQGKFDLLVLGSHGHGRLASLVLGSVAQRVLASCEVPALIVR
jgi:nucleotide-binding universal stress UspA family protein